MQQLLQHRNQWSIIIIVIPQTLARSHVTQTMLGMEALVLLILKQRLVADLFLPTQLLLQLQPIAKLGTEVHGLHHLLLGQMEQVYVDLAVTQTMLGMEALVCSNHQ